MLIARTISKINCISLEQKRGSKVSALQVDRQQFLMQQQQQLMAAGNLLRSSTSVTNILSQGQHPLSATVNSHLYQSVVGQLAQSHRALQQAVQPPHQLVDSVVSAIPDPSPLPIPGTPSPGSSSASTASGSGSGKSTDTIKRGISPASVKHVSLQLSVSSYSLSQKKPDKESIGDEKTFTHSSSYINNNNNTNQHYATSSTSGTAATAAGTTHKGVDFYEPHKSQTKSDDDNNGVVSGSKYGDSAFRLRSAYASSGSITALEKSSLFTEEYKAMRNKSSATSSSSSSQATVLSA